MQIHQNISLKSLNSFGIDVSATFLSTFTTIDELKEVIEFAEHKSLNKLILGGGTNILFTKNFDGIILKNEITSIELANEDNNFYYVKAAAGELWDSLVIHCIENNYAGIENLSLIPGSVGAAPLQNIGAYGVELKDIFYELEAFNIITKNIEKFNLKDCSFGYRESVFKTALKNQYIILNITLKLNKNPVYNIKYGIIEQELEKMNCRELSIKNISQAIINIRSSKLPNPKEIGNAGSFFKNPIIDETLYQQLIQQHSEMPVYPAKHNQYKLAAGWLIEQCGWKGYRKNDAGCHSKQALVLVNYNSATGKEVYDLSTKIVESVYDKFGVMLEREVNIM
jgi:UDP-N-acetylmuramate dehydrogenase